MNETFWMFLKFELNFVEKGWLRSFTKENRGNQNWYLKIRRRV